MDEHTKHLIAGSLTVAFYEGTERRKPYFGEERRAMPHSSKEDNREPSLSIDEVHYVYSRFLMKLDGEEKQGQRDK